MKVKKNWTSKLAVVIYFLTSFIGFSTGSLDPLWAQERVAILDSGFETYFDEGVSFTPIPVERDPLGHGTLMTQIVRGMNPDAKIYAVQICEKEKNSFKPNIEAVVKGLNWCMEKKVDIINLSFTVSEDYRITDALKRAQEQGIILIAAAGNRNFNSQFSVEDGFVVNDEVDDELFFPANHPSVISVGAVDRTGKFMPNSSRKAKVVTLGYCGGNVGTSVASARATGIVSRMLKSDSTLIRSWLKNDSPYYLK